MEGFAVGVLRMPLREFYDMDLRVYEEAVYQYYLNKQADARLAWEQVRFSTGQLMRPNLKNPSVKLTDIIKLPWDDEQERIRHALDVKAVAAVLDIIDSPLFS